MNDDPTQQGGQEEPKPTGNARNAVMAQIAQQAHQNQVEDLSGFNEETGEIETKPEKVEEPEAPAQQVVQPVTQQPETPKRLIPIVVDGKTIEVEEDKIIEAGRRTLQKESAADRRLQEATELKRKWEQIQQQPQRTQNQEPSQDAPQTAQATSQETLPTLVQGLRQEITQEVVATLTAQEAVKKFKDEFKDIVSDPDLWQLAVHRNQQRLEHAAAVGAPPGDDLEAYRAIGVEIREKFAQKTPKPVEQLQDKAEKKRTITAIPAVNATAPKPEGPKVLTVSQQIEKMRFDRASGYRTHQITKGARNG